jgi:hypothetical protein
VGFEAGSGDDLYWLAGEARVAGDMPERTSSLEIIDARWLRGGEYGGGAGGVTTGTRSASSHFDNPRKSCVMNMSMYRGDSSKYLLYLEPSLWNDESQHLKQHPASLAIAEDCRAAQR